MTVMHCTWYTIPFPYHNHSPTELMTSPILMTLFQKTVPRILRCHSLCLMELAVCSTWLTKSWISVCKIIARMADCENTHSSNTYTVLAYSLFLLARELYGQLGWFWDQNIGNAEKKWLEAAHAVLYFRVWNCCYLKWYFLGAHEQF